MELTEIDAIEPAGQSESTWCLASAIMLVGGVAGLELEDGQTFTEFYPADSVRLRGYIHRQEALASAGLAADTGGA